MDIKERIFIKVVGVMGVGAGMVMVESGVNSLPPVLALMAIVLSISVHGYDLFKKEG